MDIGKRFTSVQGWGLHLDTLGARIQMLNPLSAVEVYGGMISTTALQHEAEEDPVKKEKYARIKQAQELIQKLQREMTEP